MRFAKKRFSPSLRALLSLAIVFALIGCAQVPRQQLGTYINAYGEAQTAGTSLYLALNSAVAEGRLAEEARSKDARSKDARSKSDGGAKCGDTYGFPDCFEPYHHLPDSARPVERGVEARILSLKVIGLYNKVVSDLATGEHGRALANQLRELASSARKLTGFAGPQTMIGGPFLTNAVTTALGQLVQQIAQVRDNAAARTSILAEEPKIQALVTLLINDTSRMYTLYSTSRQQTVTQDLSSFEAARKDILAYHKSLGAYVALLYQVRRGLGELTGAIRSNAEPASNIQAAIDQAASIRLAAGKLQTALKDVKQ